MRPPQPALFHWALATGHESPGRAQLACSIARVAGCLHTDVSSPWLTHDWSDVRWDFDLRQAVGVGGLTAAAGIAIRSASCQQPRVAALVGAAAAIGLCAVARRRHRPSDLRSSCSSCSSCCQSSALTHLTRRARIVRRAKQDTCSCKQCENLVAPLSGGAALEEAAAREAQQMEAARHAKELQSQYWGRQRQQRARRDWRRLSGSKNVWAIRAIRAVRELVASSILMRI